MTVAGQSRRVSVPRHTHDRSSIAVDPALRFHLVRLTLQCAGVRMLAADGSERTLRLAQTAPSQSQNLPELRLSPFRGRG